jgi:hypothetical protein
VGSNPAGLTKEKAPEAKKNKASGVFSCLRENAEKCRI